MTCVQIDMVELTYVVKIDICTENVEFQVLSVIEHIVLTIFLHSMDDCLHIHVIS